jgi:hypothetical protein
MKPTSLSPEFYEKLYDKIINYGFEPDDEDDCHCNMDFEDFEGFYVNLEATFEVEFVDDSFDHAFGTEYGHHYECGNLEDIEAVSLTDEDGNDVSDLFDYDAFFEQFKRYEVKFLNGTVIKSGETVIGVYNGYPKEEVEFLYRDTLKEVYICKPTGDAKYKFPRSYKKVLPATEENLSRLYNR